MSKRKSIIILSILAVLIVALAVFTFLPLNNGELGIYNFDSISGYIKLGFDLKGGAYVVYDVSELEGEDEVTDANVTATVLRLQELLKNEGYNEATVSVESFGDNKHIRVEVPDVEDTDYLLELLGNPAEMAFVLEGHESDYKEEGNEAYYFLSGKDVEAAGVTLDPNNSSFYAVSLLFNESGKEKFADATTANVGKNISIVVDGVTKSTATVNEAITNGQAIITGNFDFDTAYELAMSIQSGAFNVKLDSIESGEVDATLGTSALSQALIAGAIGIVIVMVFMAFVYRKLGLVANIALLIYVLLYMLALALLPFMQLTLPGIAGVILSIGMVVDANIIIFERMKDEYNSNPGKSLENTIFPQGFKKSYSAIIDSNITTLLGAAVLWIFGTGEIIGFAMTLIVGVVLSFITSIFITRGLLNLILPFDRKNYRAYGLITREGVDL